jgi:hypothetical protein
VLYRATMLWWVDPEGSRAASIEGIALSQRVDDPLLRANAQGHALYWQLCLHGCRIADVRMAEDAIAAASAAGDREILAQSKFMLALLQHARSDFRMAAETAAEGIEIARDAADSYMYLWVHHVRGDALLQLGEWGTTLATIDEGLRIAAQTGHPHLASLLRSQVASLHTEALDFAGAAAIAREELLRQSLTDGVRQSASFELAFALLGLNQLDEAYTAFTAPQLKWAAGIAAMAWSRQVRLHQGLAQVWLARGAAFACGRAAVVAAALLTALRILGSMILGADEDVTSPSSKIAGIG